MAQLFGDPENFARVSIPLLKFEDAPDGAIYVYGKATDSTLDRDHQIIDPEFAAKSLAAWFESGANVRVMHSPGLYPAGKGVELVTGEDGGQFLKSRIVEPTAIKLVKEGVLTAYSVGIAQPQIIRDAVAKRGRVVGGETVEVSLVDRPANPSCGVTLVKMQGDAVEVLEQELVEAQPEKDAERILKGDEFTPDDLAQLLIKLGKAAGATELNKSTLSASDRKQVDHGDFAYVDSDGGEHLPVHDESHVRNAISRFNQTHFESPAAKKSAAKKILSRAQSHGIDVDEDSNVAQAAKIELPDLEKKQVYGKKSCPECGKNYHADSDVSHCEKCGTKLKMHKSFEADLRRLHDMTCPAYSWISVKEAYADADLEKNGVAAAMGPTAANLLFQMLQHEVMEDAGSGREARDIGHIAKAYACLAEFLSDEAMHDPRVVAEARAQLHKSFMEANPTAPSGITPLGPGQNPDPKRFRRPFISAGHANLTASGGPRIPDTAHVPNAGQFRRDLITSGHEADSPHNSGGAAHATGTSTAPTKTAPSAAPGEKGVNPELTKEDARTRAQGALLEMHDALAEQYDDVCLMDRPSLHENPNQPLGEVDEIDNRDAERPKSASVSADLMKMFDSDEVKSALNELIESRFETERTKHATELEKRDTELSELRAQYDELARQPDPYQAPFRGMAGVEALLGKRLTSEEPRDGAKERERKIAQYSRWLESGDPQQREAARSLLTKMINS